MKRLLDFAPVILGVTLLSVLVGLQWQRIAHGSNDFVALYVGAKFAGTADMYSRAANLRAIEKLLGGTMDSVVYTRPPFYAVLLRPLAMLPYLAAYGVYVFACLLAIVWFVVRFSKECPALPTYAAFSIPIAASFLAGQDTTILMAILGASILLTRANRNVLAGLVLSLVAIKFHLFLFLPLLLLLKRKTGILIGGAAGIAALFLTGIAGAGVGSTRAYLNVLRDPWINFSTEMTPNLHGMVSAVHGGKTLEIALAGFVVLAFLWCALRSDDYELLFALSLLCGLLMSYHSGLADSILVLFVFVLILGSSAYRPLRISIAIAATPIAYFLPLPFAAVFPCMLLAVLAIFAISLWRPAPAAGLSMPSVLKVATD